MGILCLPDVMLGKELTEDIVLSRFGMSVGRVNLKRTTFNNPDDENKTVANAVAGNGTLFPENAIQRTTEIGKTVTM